MTFNCAEAAMYSFSYSTKSKETNKTHTKKDTWKRDAFLLKKMPDEG